MVADRGLQTRRRGRCYGVQLTQVEKPREPRLGGDRRLSHLEVDRACHVADLVAHDHVRDGSDREERHGREGERQS